MSAPPLGFFIKLLVLDRAASATFYEKLGFVRVGADATFTHLRWEERGEVMLVSAPTGVLVSFTSLTELSTIAERAAGLAAPMDGPEVKPWHTRELVVTDPDGYRLNFVQPA